MRDKRKRMVSAHESNIYKKLDAFYSVEVSRMRMPCKI